jgi:hypothetical protein
LKAGCVVVVSLANLTLTVKLSQEGKKKETFPTFMDNDIDSTDIVLMGLNSMDADLKRPDTS